MIGAIASTSLALVAGTLGLVAWTVTRWPRTGAAAANEADAISILIPARNEAENIGPCIEAARQGGLSVGEVIVFDDRSADATGDIVRALSRQDARVRVLTGEELPDGWCGKNFACASLAEAAAGSWLLFLDADARLDPGGADRLLAEARSRDATMISAWPRLDMRTAWERTLMPMLNIVTFSLFPAPLSFMRDDPSLGLVHGACILASRDAYARVGGHTAVKGEIFEDQRLAQLWRARGERGFCLDGRFTVSVRMYRTLGEIWRGFQKNFYPAFRHELSFWTFLLVHGAVFAAPIVLATVVPSAVTLAALAGLVTILALLAVRFGHPVRSILLHPIAEVILFGIAFASWWRCRSGRGVEWKGRRYLAAPGRKASA